MKYEVGDKFLIEVASVLKSGYMMNNNTFFEEHKLEALKKYEGAIILVCHEQDFAQDICTIIFDAKSK